MLLMISNFSDPYLLNKSTFSLIYFDILWKMSNFTHNFTDPVIYLWMESIWVRCAQTFLSSLTAICTAHFQWYKINLPVFSDSSYPVESRNRLLAPSLTADELSLEEKSSFLSPIWSIEKTVESNNFSLLWEQNSKSTLQMWNCNYSGF